MEKENQEPWYKDGLRFQCTQCGNCCSGGPGYVWVSIEELAKIAQYVEKNKIPSGIGYLRRIGERYSLTEKNSGDCIFLERKDGKTLCKIHPVKPKQCKTWPFWESWLSSEELWGECKKTCPGVNQGKLYTIEEIDKIRNKA